MVRPSRMLKKPPGCVKPAIGSDWRGAATASGGVEIIQERMISVRAPFLMASTMRSCSRMA